MCFATLSSHTHIESFFFKEIYVVSFQRSLNLHILLPISLCIVCEIKQKERLEEEIFCYLNWIYERQEEEREKQKRKHGKNYFYLNLKMSL